MNRRDYDTLTRAIKDARPRDTADPCEYEGWRVTVQSIANALQGAEGCSGFDRTLFLKRCGV